MSYTSPLGSNFKLAQSLLASQEKEEKKFETPKRNDSSYYSDSGSSSGKMNSRNGRNSQFNYSPSRQRRSNTWKTPNARQVQDPYNSAAYYHPSMLEDPWEKLEQCLGGD